MTPSEIEPATYRFVAQCLDRLSHRAPHLNVRKKEIIALLSILNGEKPRHYAQRNVFWRKLNQED
jgi:hypothetical protein